MLYTNDLDICDGAWTQPTFSTLPSSQHILLQPLPQPHTCPQCLLQPLIQPLKASHSLSLPLSLPHPQSSPPVLGRHVLHASAEKLLQRLRDGSPSSADSPAQQGDATADTSWKCTGLRPRWPISGRRRRGAPLPPCCSSSRLSPR